MNTGLAALPDRRWDLLIVGGGITGAGILLEAARRGLSALLVERHDFAWGTSSRSSKLVHGGLRYLKEGRFALTREAVREREALLRAAPGLVDPLGFAVGSYAGRKPGRHAMLFGLAVYDRMAGRRERHWHARDAFLALAPGIGTAGLAGGICYRDARTDDARLVLRVLQEACALGGAALNYVAVTAADGGRATLRDVGGATADVRARLIVNATGAAADALRPAGADRRIRPLRGSHLVLPAWRLPLAQAVSLMHPADGRPVFAFPWEGATLVGTTDLDHDGDLRAEAAIAQGEADYLLAALRWQFPAAGLTEDDVLATFAGVRPVLDTGRADPSREARDHALWREDGLLTVTGGKLTTFRAMALDVLRAARPALPGWQADLAPGPIFAPVAVPRERRLRAAAPGQARRLAGRYGALAPALLAAAHDDELEEIPGTATLWAELRWAARHEAVRHLTDLLLRRTRLGILLRAGGGAHVLARVRAICQPELGWSDARWDAEQAAYLASCASHHSLPARRAQTA